jgi:hypothetical protein
MKSETGRIDTKRMSRNATSRSGGNAGTLSGEPLASRNLGNPYPEKLARQRACL